MVRLICVLIPGNVRTVFSSASFESFLLSLNSSHCLITMQCHSPTSLQVAMDAVGKHTVEEDVAGWVPPYTTLHSSLAAQTTVTSTYPPDAQIDLQNRQYRPLNIYRSAEIARHAKFVPPIQFALPPTPDSSADGCWLLTDISRLNSTPHTVNAGIVSLDAASARTWLMRLKSTFSWRSGTCTFWSTSVANHKAARSWAIPETSKWRIYQSLCRISAKNSEVAYWTAAGVYFLRIHLLSFISVAIFHLLWTLQLRRKVFAFSWELGWADGFAYAINQLVAFQLWWTTTRRSEKICGEWGVPNPKVDWHMMRRLLVQEGVAMLVSLAPNFCGVVLKTYLRFNFEELYFDTKSRGVGVFTTGTYRRYLNYFVQSSDAWSMWGSFLE